MKRAKNSSVDNLRGPVLRSVSRSFYLSIRLLPATLRDPIALAYLLARATDTIADTADVDAKLREESLRKLARAIQGNATEGDILDLRHSFAPLQKNEAERSLIESLPIVLKWLDQVSEDDRADVRIVLEKINRGQSLDVQRFGQKNGVRALSTENELDEYTYLVAGCVGEFWTRPVLSPPAEICGPVDRGDADFRPRVWQGFAAHKYSARCRLGFSQRPMLFSEGRTERNRH